jgi:hypothetical protein
VIVDAQVVVEPFAQEVTHLVNGVRYGDDLRCEPQLALRLAMLQPIEPRVRSLDLAADLADFAPDLSELRISRKTSSVFEGGTGFMIGRAPWVA